MSAKWHSHEHLSNIIYTNAGTCVFKHLWQVARVTYENMPRALNLTRSRRPKKSDRSLRCIFGNAVARKWHQSHYHRLNYLVDGWWWKWIWGFENKSLKGTDWLKRVQKYSVITIALKLSNITAVSFGELFYHFIATLSCHSKSKWRLAKDFNNDIEPEIHCFCYRDELS